MSFSYLCVEAFDRLGLETFTEGDAIHLRKKTTQEGFNLKEERRLFADLYENHNVEIRAQWQHDGFWGTGMRNDHPGQNDMTLPQGIDLYEWNKRNGKEPSVDTWPRMYTKEWLEKE
jgi:hypothetical protein